MVIRLGVIVVILGSVLLLREHVAPWVSPDTLGTQIHALGPWAPIAFIVVYILAPLMLFPAMLLTIVAALIWTWPWALLYVTLASNISANAGFWGGRRLGRERVAVMAGGRLKPIEDFFMRSGVSSVFLMRMLPVAPFHVVNIAAGASRLRWKDFFLGTLLATLPGRLLTVYLVGSFSLANPGTYLAAAALLLLIGLPLVLQRTVQ